MIVILVGFGKELAVYKNCRKVWDLYYETLNHGDVRIHFCQTVEHQDQEIFSEGNDLFVLKRTEDGIKHVNTLNREDSSPRWGDWTIDSNTEVIARQKLSTRWLLNHYKDDCSHIFYTNVTTLLCTKSLKAICSFLPSRNLYAGSLCKFREPFRGVDGFTFASGAGTLLSSDVASKICEEAYEALFLSLSDFKFEEYENAEGVNFSPTPESWKSGDRTVDCIIGSETALFYSSILD